MSTTEHDGSATAASGSRGTPRQHRAEVTVRRILDGAAQVLIAERYQGSTTDAFAEAAGVSVGTVYRYFDSKDDVLTALFRTRGAALTAELDDFEPDPDRSFEENLTALLSIGASHSGMTPALYHELARVPGIEDAVLELRELSVRRVASFVGSYRPDLDPAERQAAATLVVLSAEGVGLGATERQIEAGILDEFIHMATGYLSG